MELRGGEECGDVLVASGGAAAVELVVGEEGHIGVNFSLQIGRGGSRLRGLYVEGMEVRCEGADGKNRGGEHGGGSENAESATGNGEHSAIVIEDRRE